MQRLDAIPAQKLAGLRGVFADIDDTISSEGKILPEAFQALWDLHDAGLKVVPVTGRPAGWCDHIARFWPVDAVVGENGGFYFFHDGEKLHQRYMHDDVTRAGFRARLESIRDRILREVPGAGIASDQQYREYDLAIDFCEDVAPLPREAVVKIRDIFQAMGAHAKISSIHVNGWFGDFDKRSTTQLCARELFGVDLEKEKETFAFCGDSPNDEPMFAFFPLSFGMANLRPYLDLVEHRPRCLTDAPAGKGFVQVAHAILEARKESLS